VCTDHAGKYCYKPPESTRPSDHVAMESRHIRDWTTSILAGVTTIQTPPRSEEFERLLHPRQRPKGSSTMDSITPNAHGPPVVVNFTERRHQRSYSPRTPYRSPQTSPHTPYQARHSRHGRPRSPMPYSSPLIMHPLFDRFDGDGLLAFMDYCERKYKSEGNTEFQEAYQVLSLSNIRVDTLSGKNAKWIKSEGVKSGTADRMARSYLEWRGELQKHR